MADSQAAAKQMCTFYLDNHFFGVEVQRVREVLLPQHTTPVPKAPRCVRGLINVRGQIFTSLDLRRCLQLDDLQNTQQSVNVVVSHGESNVSLAVDRIGEVLEVHEHDFELPPDSLRGISRELIGGVYKLADSLLLVLNTEKAIETAVGAH